MADDNQTITDAEAEDIAAGKPVEDSENDDGYLKLRLGKESDPLPNGEKIIITQLTVGSVPISQNGFAVIRPEDKVRIWSKGGLENFSGAFLLAKGNPFPIEKGSYEQTGGNEIIFRVPEGEGDLIGEGTPVRIVLIGRGFQAEVNKSLSFLLKTDDASEKAKKAKEAQERAERINKDDSGIVSNKLNLSSVLTDIASSSSGGVVGSALLTQFKNALLANDTSKLESLAKEASGKGNVKILEEVLNLAQNQAHKDVLFKHIRLAKNVELKNKEQVKVQSNKTVGGKVSVETGVDLEDDTAEAAENISGEVSMETTGQVTESGAVNVSTSGTATTTAGIKTEVSGKTVQGTQNVSVSTSSDGGVSRSGAVTKEVGVSQTASGGGSTQQTVTASSQGSQGASVSAQVSAGAGGQVSASGSVSAEEQAQVSGQVSAQGSLNTNEEQEALAQSKTPAEVQQEQGIGNIESKASLGASGKAEENLQAQSQLKQNQPAQEPNINDQGPLEDEAESGGAQSDNNRQNKEAVLKQKDGAEQATAKVSGNVASKENESGDAKENQPEKIAPSKAGLEILERLKNVKGPSGLNKDLERVNMRAAGDERAPQSKGQTAPERSKSAGRQAGEGKKVNTPLGGSLNRPENNLDSEGGESEQRQPKEREGGGVNGDLAKADQPGEQAPGQQPGLSQKQQGQKPEENKSVKEPEAQENPEAETAPQPQLPVADAAGGVTKEAVGQVAKSVAKNLAKQGLAIIMPYVLWTLAFFIGILVIIAVIVGIAYAGCTNYPVFKLTYPTVCETLENIGKSTNSSSNAQSTSSSAPAPSPTPTTGGVNPR